MGKRKSSLKKRLNMLLLVCLVPLSALTIYLLVMTNRFSMRYDEIVKRITIANAYSIDFKEDIDYSMYIIAVNAERAEELIDTEEPHALIQEAREVFHKLYDLADSSYAKNRVEGILSSLETLEDCVEEIENDALVIGAYDKNMERLDLNIRVLTELIQEQIQKYIYYEATNLESLREGIRQDVETAIRMTVGVFFVILGGAILVSRKILTGLTGPINELCRMAKLAGRGDFKVRVPEGGDEEVAILNASFNHMVDRLGTLVEDIRVEQLNLRAMELKLLQAQINPHFLYNTLDAIIWLAEAGEKEQVVKMVSSLSDFFRTTLSKGRDYISIQEEEAHIRSYLEIQQFRYRDILEYEIAIPEELYQYQILKLTLQPLVENALYHGIKNKRGLGRILVTGEMQGDEIVFQVQDNGKGMTAVRLEEVRGLIEGKWSDEEARSGFGLSNVEERIRLNYGPRYGIQINSEYGEWTQISVRIPAVKN